MKKIFTLLAVAAMAISANAADVYSWQSNAGEVTEVGGKATYENGNPDVNRVNYANGDYYTICLNGKKAEMGGDPSDNAGYVQIALDAALEEGCSLELNGYLNKGEEKTANAYVVFEDGAGNVLSDFNETDSYPDIQLNPELCPSVHSIEAPAGTKVIKMTRNKSQTNVFLVTVKVTKEGGNSGIADVVAAENAPVEYFNLQGVRVDNPANGLYIRRQGENVTKVLVK